MGGTDLAFPIVADTDPAPRIIEFNVAGLSGTSLEVNLKRRT